MSEPEQVVVPKSEWSRVLDTLNVMQEQLQLATKLLVAHDLMVKALSGGGMAYPAAYNGPYPVPCVDDPVMLAAVKLKKSSIITASGAVN